LAGLYRSNAEETVNTPNAAKPAPERETLAQRMRLQGIENGWSTDRPWDELPEARRESWRLMADIAIAELARVRALLAEAKEALTDVVCLNSCGLYAPIPEHWSEQTKQVITAARATLARIAEDSHER
jgi:hypothetical protein